VQKAACSLLEEIRRRGALMVSASSIAWRGMGFGHLIQILDDVNYIYDNGIDLDLSCEVNGAGTSCEG
jgi:hypothetical protein